MLLVFTNGALLFCGFEFTDELEKVLVVSLLEFISEFVLSVLVFLAIFLTEARLIFSKSSKVVSQPPMQAV